MIKTKEELLKELRALHVGHSIAVTSTEMSDIFSVGVNLLVVSAWLKEVGLSGIEATEGDGTTCVFKRHS